MPNNLIIANAEMSPAQSDALTAISGIAYSGGAIRQPWSEMPIYVDLQGLTIRAQVPLLYSHTNEPYCRLGAVTATVADNQLAIEGGIDKDMPYAAGLIEAGKKIPWQLSVGILIAAMEEIKPGESRTVNGQDVTGPAYVAAKSELQEVSVVAVGANANTQLNILASLNLTTGEPNMPNQTPAPTPNPAPTPDEIRAAAATAERQRIADIDAICVRHPEIRAQAVSENWSADRTRQAVLEAINASYQTTTPQLPAGTRNTGMTANIIRAAAFQALNVPEANIIQATSQQDLEAADRRWHGNISLQEIILEAAAANGNPISGHSLNGGNWHEAVGNAIRAAAGYTSIDLPGILGGIINRELLEGYGAVESVWDRIARIMPVKDFREITSYRLVSGGGFQKVLPHGELQHGTYSETSYTNKAETYGKIVGLSRQDIINDDLGALASIPQQLGLDAAMTFNEIFWKEFLDNSTFFKTQNKNYLTGNALSIEGLGAAVKKFRELKDESGRMIGVAPAILLVGGSNEVLADKLFADANVIAIGVGATAATTPNGNPFKGKYQPVCSVYLEDTSLSGYSTTAYYLLAKPAFRAAMQVCFLNGNRTPTVQSSEMDFNTLGIQFRAYYDFGCAKMDPFAGVKVTGA